MDPQEYFTREWPALVPKLRATLARAGVPVSDRDDLIQETAARLLGAWTTIDWGRGAEPLATVIALNAWRDQWRRRGAREVLGNVPEQAAVADTERTALARMEIREVSRALGSMRPSVARVLQIAAAESEGTLSPRPASAATRMARTRARRALSACLKVASAAVAAVVVSVRWFSRPAPSTVAMGAVAGVACLFAVTPSIGSSTAPRWAAEPMTATTAGQAPGAGTVTEPVTTSPATPGVSRLRGIRREAPQPYVVGAGPASVGLLLTVDVNGTGAQVRKPQPGSAPVCTFGAAPTTPAISRCDNPGTGAVR